VAAITVSMLPRADIRITLASGQDERAACRMSMPVRSSM